MAARILSEQRKIALSPDHRPDSKAVADWYERVLMRLGASVRRIDDAELEFDVGLAASQDAGPSLVGLSSGTITVSETSDGFEVEATAAPETKSLVAWILIAPAVVAIVSSFAFYGSIGAGAGVALIAAAWLRAAWRLRGLLAHTNAAIAESYTSVAPAAAPGLLPHN